MDSLDGAFASMLTGGDEQVKLATLSEKYMDTLLKYMQILYFADQLDRDDLVDDVSKKVEPMIQVLLGNLNDTVRKYQEKHGEI